MLNEIIPNEDIKADLLSELGKTQERRTAKVVIRWPSHVLNCP